MAKKTDVQPIPEGYHTITPYLTVEDGAAALEFYAEASEVMPVQDHFYGDRSGMVEDPFGHRWSISTHVEDVPPDELERRAKQVMSEM